MNTHINQLKLKIPVVDLVHVPGTLQAVLDMNLPAHVDLEIYIPENFPQSTVISPEDQATLDASLARTKAVLAQVTSISTKPPGA